VQITQPASLGLYYAPSLFFVDSRGGVTDVLMRRLNADQEAMVRARITGAGRAPLNNATIYRTITQQELEAIVKGGGRIVDIRDREQFRQGATAGALNLPFDELRDRALLELATGAPTVVDCTSGTLPRCHQATDLLRRLDFPDVVLYRGTR
jgi:rhodanese-related sulfurtransferase